MFKFILLVAIFGLAAAASLESDVRAEVTALENDITPEGNFRYSYQTSNGIEASAVGDANAVQGQYKYVSPEGIQVELSYGADSDGFRPVGDLPTPPPIPEAILRAISWNEAHPEQENRPGPDRSF